MWLKRLLSKMLLAIGVVLLLASLIYFTCAELSTWLQDKDRYLVLNAGNLLPVRTLTVKPSALPAPDPQVATPPVRPSASVLTPESTATGGAQQGPESESIPEGFASSDTGPTATPVSPVPVRLRIPSIGVDRSIVELPLTYDSRTQTWTRDIQILLRGWGKDLVGHWGGSAYPGQAGNTILVGHNYGYGYNGVFVSLGRLKPGQQVSVLDNAGQTYLYRVTKVARVPWRRKDLTELAQHQVYLATDGPERLTLVSCGGATWAPFPVRIYVVAEPVR